jgi:hypothetical protein
MLQSKKFIHMSTQNVTFITLKMLISITQCNIIALLMFNCHCIIDMFLLFLLCMSNIYYFPFLLCFCYPFFAMSNVIHMSTTSITFTVFSKCGYGSSHSSYLSFYIKIVSTWNNITIDL